MLKTQKNKVLLGIALVLLGSLLFASMALADADPDHSTFIASPDTLPADNTTEGYLIATVKDNLDNPLSDQTVTVVQIGGSGNAVITPASVMTDGWGEAYFTVKSPTVELAHFRATINGTINISN